MDDQVNDPDNSRFSRSSCRCVDYAYPSCCLCSLQSLVKSKFGDGNDLGDGAMSFRAFKPRHQSRRSRAIVDTCPQKSTALQKIHGRPVAVRQGVNLIAELWSEGKSEPAVVKQSAMRALTNACSKFPLVSCIALQHRPPARACLFLATHCSSHLLARDSSGSRLKRLRRTTALAPQLSPSFNSSNSSLAPHGA